MWRELAGPALVLFVTGLVVWVLSRARGWQSLGEVKTWDALPRSLDELAQRRAAIETSAQVARQYVARVNTSNHPRAS